MHYIWLARFGSFFAEHLLDSIIAILVWKLTNSEVIAGFTIASGRIALWMFGLKAGQVTDSANKAKVLKYSAFITALAAWLMAISYQLDILTALLLALLNYSVMASKTFEYTAINTLISNIKDTSDFKKNNVLIDSSKRLARILSLVTLILFLDKIDGYALMFFIAASYTLVFFCYLKTVYPNEANKKVVKTNPTVTIRLAKEILSKEILVLFVFFGLYNISYFSTIWIFLPYHFSTINSESGFGWTLLAFSVGGFIGNRVYKRLCNNGNSFVHLLLAFMIVGLSCFMFAVNDNLLYICISAAVAGSGLPLMDMAMINIIRYSVSENHHGIAFAVFRFIADFGLILGGLFGGILLQLFSDPIIYIITGSWLFILLFVIVILKIKDNDLFNVSSAQNCKRPAKDTLPFK